MLSPLRAGENFGNVSAIRPRRREISHVKSAQIFYERRCAECPADNCATWKLNSTKPATQNKFEHSRISDTRYEAPDNRPRTMAECDVNLGSFYIMSPAGIGEVARKIRCGRAVTPGHGLCEQKRSRVLPAFTSAREICLLCAYVILCARAVHKYVK